MYDWESKWKKPFLKGKLTHEETLDFYMMMAIDPIKAEFLTDKVMGILNNYLHDSQTATTFSTGQNGQNGNNSLNKGKILTAEELYVMMFAAGIPLEFENRNLNRLLTILRITAARNGKPEKMNKQDILRQNAMLNAQRKAQYKTKG